MSGNEKKNGAKRAGKTPKPGRAGRRRYGSVSALLLVLLAASLAALNIGISALETKNDWKIDASFNRISTHSEATRILLKDLPHGVHIYALFRKGDEDAPLLELLNRYSAANGKITWETTDPGLNPALLSRFATTDRVPAENDLIVFCEETGRWQVLGPDDYVSVSMDMETGEFSYAGWTYEKSISEAIDYVTRDRVPRVVILQGHGELDGEALKAFDDLMTGNRYEVVYEDLMDPDYIPDPQDLLVFFSPLRDITGEELAKVTDFAAKGGSFLFTRDFSDPTGSMPNYAALLRSYGFIPKDGVVIADEAAAGTYYSGTPTYLLPVMVNTDITMDLIGSGATQILLPGAAAFETPEETDRNLTVSVVLRSGETSYLKVLTGSTVSIDRAEGDETGAFALALQARRITSEGYLSRAFIIGCSAAMTDEQVYSMTDMPQLIMRTSEFLLDAEASDLNIMAREALRPSLGVGSTGLGSVLLAALPLLVLLAALLVLPGRRNR